MEIVIGYLIIVVFQWVLCYGALFASLQKRWPTIAEDYYIKDRSIAIAYGGFMALYPIFGLIIVFFLCQMFKHGFKWK